MPAIKAVNTKNLKVKRCVFSGYDTAIELENVEGFLSENNTFSRGNNPQILIRQLINSIKESKLDNSSKERLYMEVFSFLSRKESNINVETLKEKILRFLGYRAVDYFVQLAAAVTAGLIIRLR